MKRRLLSILLLICMMLTLFPVSAFAEEDAEEAPVCVCTEACADGAVNHDCPVCGTDGAQACTCAEEVIVVNAVDDTEDAGDADDVDNADEVDTPEAADFPGRATVPLTAEAAPASSSYILTFDSNGGGECLHEKDADGCCAVDGCGHPDDCCPKRDMRIEIKQIGYIGISKAYDGTAEGTLNQIYYTDGTNRVTLTDEGEDANCTITAVYDLPDIGNRTVTVTVTLTEDAAKQYKFQNGTSVDIFTITGDIYRDGPRLTLKAAKTDLLVGDFLLDAFSVDGVMENAEVTYRCASDPTHVGLGDDSSNEELFRFSKATKAGEFWIYATTEETTNYYVGRTAPVKITVHNFCTVQFDGNGVGLPIADKQRKVPWGWAYGALPAPSNDGYELAGWYTEKDGGTKIEATDTVPSGIAEQTFYAHWETHGTDSDGDGLCDWCGACVHAKAAEGYCTVDGCTHSADGKSCCRRQPVLTPPTVKETLYIDNTYDDLKNVTLIGGKAEVDGKAIEGAFMLVKNSEWTNADLKAGELACTVRFTPNDLERYTTATCTMTVNVRKLEVVRIGSVSDITDKTVGTEFTELGLPDKISFAAGHDGTEVDQDCLDSVVWDESTYNSNLPFEQTVTGTLKISALQDRVEQPGEPASRVRIKVKLQDSRGAPEIATAPSIQWTKGSFRLDANQIFVGDVFKLGTDASSGETGELIGGEAKIGDTAVSGTFTLEPGAQISFTGEGQYDVAVVFTPDDRSYAPVRGTITVTAVRRTVRSITSACDDITGKYICTAFDALGLPAGVSFETEDGKVYSDVSVTWDEKSYDPYSIAEQTVTGTLDLNETVKQPEQEIKASVKVKLEKTEDYIRIYYRIFNSTGEVEFSVDGLGALLVDYVDRGSLADYKLRDISEIFKALQDSGRFKTNSADGYSLDGWYLKRDYDSYVFSEKIENADEIPKGVYIQYLHGKLIPNTVKVTLDPCGGVLSEGESPVDRMYGSIYRDLPTPTRHGYTFDGWYTAETDGDRISYYSEVEQMTDHTIYAHWKRDYNHLATPKQTDAALKTPADCENDAVYFWSCSGCGLLDTSRTFTVKGTAFGHDYTWTSNGNGTHTGVCSHDKSHIKTENCSGGTATCTKKAVCAKCGAEYGDLGDHTYGTEWHSDSTHHWHECFRCKGVDSKVLHADNDKDHRCDACYHLLSTCADSNNDHKCDVCGKQLSTCADNNNDHLCDICSKRLTEHTGGTATCTKKAVCTFCGKEYGELAPHSFTAENTDAKYLKTAAT